MLEMSAPPFYLTVVYLTLSIHLIDCASILHQVFLETIPKIICSVCVFQTVL